MGKVTFNMSMSLDGFIDGPNDAISRLFRWYNSGDVDVSFPGSDMVFKVSRASAEMFQREWGKIGAMVTGRRNFDISRAWSGHPPLGVHHFVVTHTIPHEWAGPGSPFTFVTDGAESAIRQAKMLAGDKSVVISTASVLQQGLKAGLVDEITIDLVPILLGDGIRLFDHLGTNPIELEPTRVIEGKGVTHLAYRVVK